MGSSFDLTSELQRTLGFSGFRPGQEPLIRAVLEGRDALGILPTGGGKSVCFQLPAFLLSGIVLVVSPLVSLMEDQAGRARKAGLRADFLTSATPATRRAGVVQRALEGRTDLLLVAPERFLVPAFRSMIPRMPVEVLAVDEAHCISQWGHDFRPAYLRIGEIRSMRVMPTLALTATATLRVRKEIEAFLLLRAPERVVGSFDRPNLAWEVRMARGHGEKLREIRSLLQDRIGASIVYASTRRAVEAVRSHLASFGLPALSYHAGLSPERRTAVQSRFLEDPAPVVVATNAFGMGIDRSDVRLVIHYQLSGSLEGYYQEAGRAGRDGNPARCVALHAERDRRIHEAFLTMSHPPENRLRELLRWLRRQFPSGETRAIPFDTLVDLFGKEGGQEGVMAGLRSLEKAGALCLEGEEFLEMLPGPPDLGRVETLRNAARAQLRGVETYARGGRCRRRIILEYFGQAVPGRSCGRCDWCLQRLSERIMGRVLALAGR
ncbi:MAG: RecQ family ATP-dependent DNA helicase [Longimicrobiales bacterium]